MVTCSLSLNVKVIENLKVNHSPHRSIISKHSFTMCACKISSEGPILKESIQNNNPNKSFKDKKETCDYGAFRSARSNT